MRVLVTIAHFFGSPPEQSSERERGNVSVHRHASYGSVSGSVQSRATAFQSCLDQLRQHFSGRNLELDNHTGMIGSGVNQSTAEWKADILICTIPSKHLLDTVKLPKGTTHSEADVDSQQLGFECHRQMRRHAEAYDYFCFLEDDILISDPLFFSKHTWFHQQFGNDCILQPNRYEIDPQGRKVYVDGPLPEKHVRRYFDPDDHPVIEANCLDRSFRFFRSSNPTSACFVLNQEQLRRWVQSPCFDDRDASFGSALESAQILGPMKLFRVYKPVAEQAEFLEVVHADARLTRMKSPSLLLQNMED